MGDMPQLRFNIHTDEDKNRLFDQYHFLLDSINQMEGRRENTNIFFSTINSAILTGSQLVGNMGGSYIQAKFIILGLILAIGIILSFSWVSVLNAYRRLEHIYFSTLQLMENHFPSNVFTYCIERSSSFVGDKKTVIVSRELFVPIFFLIAYMVVGILAVWS
jgi:hypothetical protein